MALRFMDSFDHYASADLLEKWTAMDSATIVAGGGRRSTAAVSLSQSYYYLHKALDSQPTWIVGFACKITAIDYTSTYLLQIFDGSTMQVYVDVTSGGVVRVVRGGGTTLGTASGTVSLATWFYLELFVTIHPSAGVVQLAINGATVLSLTGQNTQNSANAFADKIGLGASSFSTIYVIDDLYICDGTGSAPHNTFLGDCRVDTLLPTADGSNSAWACSTGTAHAALVDDTVPNDDTDYLSSNTASARDTHAMGNLPSTSVTILGVQHCMSAKKEDAGTCTIKSCLKSGATTEAGATTHALSTSYAFYREVWPTDPHTDAAWTTTAIDAVEAGVEKS